MKELPNICIFCLKTYDDKDSILIRCGHYFHSDCIALFVSEHDICPLSRMTSRLANERSESTAPKLANERSESTAQKTRYAQKTHYARCYSVDDMLYGYIPLDHILQKHTVW